MGALRSFFLLLLLAAPAALAEQYVVQKGDTLSTIAAAKGTTVDDILSVNPGLKSHPDSIEIGAVINLPTSPPAKPSPGPGGSGGASPLISAAQWQTIFPSRVGSPCDAGAEKYYSYDNFIKGMGGVLSSKLEVAAFLANVGHETGGLCFIHERNAAEMPYCGSWCSTPCASGKSYHGRGPLQLSYQCNYEAFGTAVLGDDRLIKDPDLLAADGVLGFQSAKWFWMAQGPHDSIKVGKGFGSTIRAINGPQECDNGPGSKAVQSRVQLFKQYCGVLGVDPGSNLDC